MFQGFALEGEAVFETFGDITSCAAEAQHRVFFVRFVDAATHQVGVLVGFEVGHTDDGFTRVNRCSQCCHAFCDFIDIEVDRRSVAGDAAGNFRFQFVVLFIKFQQGFGVDTDLAVDDEFHACQTDAFARQIGKAECELWVTDVHHYFYRCFRHVVQSNIGNLYVQQAGVDKAGIAFGTGYGNFLTVFQQFGCIAAADNGRNAQFARDNRRVAGASAAVGNDGGSTFHHGFPIRIGHVGNQYVAGFDGIHLGSIFNQTYFTLSDFLTDGTAFA